MYTTIDYNWQKDAACAAMSKENYDAFFSSRGRSARKDSNNICATCPVIDACLNHALKYEDYGFWANTSAQERTKMRKELGIELERIDFLSMLIAESEAEKQEEIIQRHKMKRGPKGPRKIKEESCELD